MDQLNNKNELEQNGVQSEPSLCCKCFEFYGDPRKDNLCSKCSRLFNHCWDHWMIIIWSLAKRQVSLLQSKKNKSRLSFTDLRIFFFSSEKLFLNIFFREDRSEETKNEVLQNKKIQVKPPKILCWFLFLRTIRKNAGYAQKR